MARERFEAGQIGATPAPGWAVPAADERNALVYHCLDISQPAVEGVLALGLAPWGDRLPRVPEGDVVVVLDCAARTSVSWGASVQRADGVLRRWPVTGLSLLALALPSGAVMLAGH
jgi:hypothetical protein